MNAIEGLSFRAVNEKRGPVKLAAPGAVVPATPAPTVEETPNTEAPAPARASALPFDPWRLVMALCTHARWIVLSGLVFAALGGALGLLRFHHLYLGSASLIRQELPNTFQASETGESFKPKQLTVGTLISVLHSPVLLKKVSEQTQPPISPAMLDLKLTVTPEKNTEVIRVDYEGAISALATANILKVYGDAVVQLTSDLQSEDASQVNRVLSQQLETIDSELASAGRAILHFSREANLVNADKETDAYLREVGDLSLKYETMRIDYETIDLKLAALEKELARHNPMAARLQEARTELNNMLVRYTEANPAVADQRGKVESIEKEMAEAAAHPLDNVQMADGTAGTSLYLELVELKAQKETLAHQLEKLARVRDDVQAKLSALPEKSVQLERMKARQQSLLTARTILGSRQREAQMFAENAPGYYRVFATPTPTDVAKKSRWPKVIIVAFALGVLGMLGATGAIAVREVLDERIKTAHDLARVTRLPVVLRLPPLDTASASDARQWAFRSWTSLAPGLRASPGGALVLGVMAAAGGAGCSTLLYRLAGAAAQRGHSVVIVADRDPVPEEMTQGLLRSSLDEALADPRAIFAGVEAANPAVRLLAVGPDQSWTDVNRRQWLNALAAWRAVRSLVVLVELPVSADPEALLLAESMPNLLWVAADSAHAGEQRRSLEIVRETRCQLVGAAFNQRQSSTGLAWLGKWAALCISAALVSVHGMAAETPAATPQAEWQQRLTLGAGDTVDISFFGHPDATRNQVTVGPDGNISYLEAHDIPAAGTSIDELRAALDAELSKFYRNARTIVTPGIIQSKRYYILGKVIDKGAFTLDRPLTLLEAVARSRGLETGLFEKNTVELADLPRSFLCRHGKRMPVDFEKLFQHADLSQNIALEPEDYIYFPSANVNEVYVLGAVKSPGIQGITPNATVVSIVTVRGGFTEKANLSHVLVVRGSLTKPKVIVVDVGKILKGHARDFILQPKDIVYVTDKPWEATEELLDVALRTFVQGAASGWATGNVGPLITTPFIPSVR
jgi:protein involved in polysaccharide export with SLBB domain/capsular polysaccharide biosynthesis protein